MRNAAPAAKPAQAASPVVGAKDIKKVLQENSKVDDLWNDITDKIDSNDLERLLRAYVGGCIVGTTFSTSFGEYTIYGERCSNAYYMVSQNGETARRFCIASASELQRSRDPQKPHACCYRFTDDQ